MSVGSRGSLRVSISEKISHYDNSICLLTSLSFYDHTIAWIGKRSTKVAWKDHLFGKNHIQQSNHIQSEGVSVLKVPFITRFTSCRTQ